MCIPLWQDADCLANNGEQGYAVAQMVSCRPLTAETWIQSQASPCGISFFFCGGTDFVTGYSLHAEVFSCQYHSTIASHMFIYLSPVLYNLSN